MLQMNKHSPQYKAALQSKHWKRLKSLHMHWNEFRCAKCNRYESEAGGPLELHHLNYERLGRERPDDTVLLCPECHEKADKVRAEDTRVRQAQRLYDARLDGWATKVYGEEWHSEQDPEAVARDFDDWVERKSE